MDIKTFNTMKDKIEKYFESVSKEKLQKDLEESGYHFYKQIKTAVIDSTGERQMSVEVYTTGTPPIHRTITYSKQFDSADSYNYKIAA